MYTTQRIYIILILSFLSLFILPSTLSCYETDEVPLTRWMSTLGDKPLTYEEYINQHPVISPFTINKVNESKLMNPSNNVVYLIVNANLYNSIIPELTQYQSDLEQQGYFVRVYITSGGTPAELREFLASQLRKDIVGCVFIGDLPVAWYETSWYEMYTFTAFPIDIYYMDLDGEWVDSDNNGKYDRHRGATALEIWMGRLTASPLTYTGADEVTLLKNYFAKNHDYREGNLSLQNRALVYIDDDWEPWAYDWNQDVGLAYSNRTLVAQSATTDDEDYENRLTQNYEFVQLCAHSSPTEHYFYYMLQHVGSTYYYEVVSIDPEALFYNLFACSNCSYVQSNYMGGWYIFSDTYGLAAVGSTKTGSMLEFQDFYRPLGENNSFGESFRQWYNLWGETDPNWFYGMTVLGDPTLTIDITHPNVTVTITPDTYTVPAGGNFGYTVSFTNLTGSTQSFYYWADVILPNGNPYPRNPVYNPSYQRVSAYGTKSLYITHYVPTFAPLGNYTYIGRIGYYPLEVWDRSSVQIKVTASTSSVVNNPYRPWEVIHQTSATTLQHIDVTPLTSNNRCYNSYLPITVSNYTEKMYSLTGQLIKLSAYDQLPNGIYFYTNDKKIIQPQKIIIMK